MLWSQEKYLKAWNFAATAHKGQTMPGSDLPYITHIGGVAMEVMTAMAAEPVDDPDLAIQCALLHDVIEDTRVGYEEVRSEFGKAVADGVQALSKDERLPTKAERMKDSLERIVKEPREIWIVKLADRITNLQRPPSHWDKGKIIAYREEAILIHSKLRSAHRVLDVRLVGKIEQYERYTG